MNSKMNWIMYAPGHLCLRNDGDFFKNKTFTNGTILRKETINAHTFEYTSYENKVYAISHNGLTLWILSRKSLPSVYEYLVWNKPVPQWESFVAFVKEL